MDWNAVEQTLFDASHEALARFASTHASEKFYGFCFDVNADYGEVLLCLNTEEDLANRATTSYSKYSQQDIEDRLRWNTGDWKYQGFNNDEPLPWPLPSPVPQPSANQIAWEEMWSPMQDAIASETSENEDAAEEFLESVCRVLIRLERSEAFLRLNREPHFQTLVTNHDEDQEDSWNRLARIRGGDS